VLGRYAPAEPPVGLDEAGAESFPASDPIAVTGNRACDRPATPLQDTGLPARPHHRVRVKPGGGQEAELDPGAVVIAAITSCTISSNPEVMIGAALLAKKAAERGPAPKPWVKTSLAPGSRVACAAVRVHRLRGHATDVFAEASQHAAARDTVIGTNWRMLASSAVAHGYCEAGKRQDALAGIDRLHPSLVIYLAALAECCDSRFQSFTLAHLTATMQITGWIWPDWHRLAAERSL